MQKEVIYIDVDDDITAIIGKIKASKEKIVALVPPKRTGILQSAVNLRLLDRMAKTEHKNLVIITSNAALLGLTASAKIPTAKNLQSKPEVAEIAALKIDDDDDLIDGADLPIGDHVESVGGKTSSRDDVIETIDIDAERDSAKAAIVAKSAKPKKSRVKIPNFDSFRKRFVLSVVIGVLVIGGLVWALAFAPAATIVITANTTPVPINNGVTLTTDSKVGTGAKKSTLLVESQQKQVNSTVDFTPTGTKMVGDKAKGAVQLANCSSAFTLPANTTFTSSDGYTFTNDAAVSVPAGTCSYFSSHPGAATANITATDVGTSYNESNGASFTVAGHSSSTLQVTASTAISGGNSHQATVISDQDIQTAIGQIVGNNTDDVKKELTNQFKNGEVVIASSFTTDQGQPATQPDQNTEIPDGTKATLTVPITYTLYGVNKAELKKYLDGAMQETIGSTSSTQKAYDNGLKGAEVTDFVKADDGTLSASVLTTGQIGPKIDEDNIKDLIKGKITGDVQQIVSNIDGVSDVKVDYSYFWVSHVPNNTKKITIEFKVQNE